MLLALTREVSAAIAQCELTHLSRARIDVARARRQHEEYERALAHLGCTVKRLPSGDDMPDSVFIEDTAIVVGELAVIARPGAQSRRAESAAVAEELKKYRTLVFIESPGTIDGGDVLTIGRSIYVGLSSRTNMAAVEQMRHRLAPHGYDVRPVTVTGCLHLKSAVTAVSDRAVLMNRRWAPVDEFRGFETIDVHDDEPYAANIVRAGNGLVYPQSFPKTTARLAASGFTVTSVDVSELAKAEGAVTCCSLIFDV